MIIGRKRSNCKAAKEYLSTTAPRFAGLDCEIVQKRVYYFQQLGQRILILVFPSDFLIASLAIWRMFQPRLGNRTALILEFRLFSPATNMPSSIAFAEGILPLLLETGLNLKEHPTERWLWNF